MIKTALLEFVCVAGPKFAGGALTLGLNILLIRYLDPVQFGIYSLCVTAILLSESIFGAPFDMGVVRLCSGNNSQDGLAFEKAALVIKLLLGLVIMAGLAFFAKPLAAHLFQGEGGPDLIIYSALSVLSILLLRSSLVHLQVKRRFLYYGIIDSIQILVKFGGIGLLLLYLLTPAPEHLLMVFIAAPLTAFVIAQFTVSRKLTVFWKVNRSSSKILFGFVKWFLAINALGVLISRLDIFMLASFSTIEAVGVYSGGQVFAIIPEMLGAYLAVIISPRIIPYCQSGKFLKLFIQVQTGLLALAVIIFLSVWLLWDFLVAFALPESYAFSGKILLILLPGTLAGMTTFPLALSFIMFVRRRFLVYMDSVSLPVLLIANYYVIPLYGAEGVAYVTSASLIIRSLIVQLSALYFARLDPIPFDSEVDASIVAESVLEREQLPVD